jgi:serine/threonine protein kinase
MAKGTNKQFSILSSRQIPHTRLYDDGSLETRYDLLNKLGEGSFGTVYRVKNRENDLFFAMKTIPKKVSCSCISINRSF